jgi:hypothetical protein
LRSVSQSSPSPQEQDGPRTPCSYYSSLGGGKAQTVRCTPHGNIELVPQKQVFDFKPAPRPEQVGDKPHKQMKERKHHVE